MSQQLMTVELLKVALPKALHSNATQAFADTINALATAEPETAEEIRANFLTYSKVLQEGKYKTEDYLSAVTYVTHKLMGYNNSDAYIRTFPARYQALVARGASSKDISAYVAAYHKNKLVNLLLEQSLIPAHVTYQDVFHMAVQTQARIMNDPNASPKVQSDAANSILTHLKAPETKKVELDVNVKNAGGIDDLREVMAGLAKRQLELIDGGGATPADMARQPLLLSQQQKAEAIDMVPVVEAEPEPVVVQAEQEPEPTTAAPPAQEAEATAKQFPPRVSLFDGPG